MACPNCGAAPTGAFCPQCGQKQGHTDLTIREFLHELLHELGHWEGRIPRTLKALLFQPGLLTLDFLAGRRARWLPPLRLYLICSVAYFLIGPAIEAITHKPTNGPVHFGLTGNGPVESGPLSQADRDQLAAGLPARIFGLDRLERAAADNAKLNRAVDAIFPKAMFVLVPLFAAVTRLVWRAKGLRYPAHLYLALHLHAAWFGMFALTKLAAALVVFERAAMVVGVIAVAYVLVYSLVALHRVFHDSWVMTVAKAAGTMMLYLVCFFPVSLALLAYVIWTI